MEDVLTELKMLSKTGVYLEPFINKSANNKIVTKDDSKR